MSKKVPKTEEAPPKEAAKKEAPKPQKGDKAPAPKSDKKKSGKGISALYKIDGDKVTRVRPTCERCGPGYFMADHNERFTCGHCGFTRYKRA